MDEKRLEARVEALEKKQAEFERHVVESIGNLTECAQRQQGVIANLVEAITGRRRRDKPAVN